MKQLPKICCYKDGIVSSSKNENYNDISLTNFGALITNLLLIPGLIPDCFTQGYKIMKKISNIRDQEARTRIRIGI